MDGLSEELSVYPSNMAQATDGAPWSDWFDRITGAYMAYRTIKQNDPVRNEGQPQYLPGKVSVAGSIDTSTVLMLGVALLAVWFVVKK